MDIETVKIKSDDHPIGYIIINKDSLTSQDVVYGESKQTVSPTPSRAKVSRNKSK